MVTFNEVLNVQSVRDLNKIAKEFLNPNTSEQFIRELFLNKCFIYSEDYMLPQHYVEDMVAAGKVKDVLDKINSNRMNGVITDSVKVFQILKLIQCCNPGVAETIDKLLDKIEVWNTDIASYL